MKRKESDFTQEEGMIGKAFLKMLNKMEESEREIILDQIAKEKPIEIRKARRFLLWAIGCTIFLENLSDEEREINIARIARSIFRDVNIANERVPNKNIRIATCEKILRQQYLSIKEAFDRITREQGFSALDVWAIFEKYTPVFRTGTPK